MAGPSDYDYSYSAKAPAKDPVPLAVPCFTAGEIQFDLFTIYADPRGSVLDSGWGGGIGGSYYFTENFGLMGRAYWWDEGSVLHTVNASAIVRAPIQSICLAPYLFGGIGGHFDGVNQFGSHLGAGLEFRMTERIGIFADYSYNWAEKTEDWNLFSAGVRFAF